METRRTQDKIEKIRKKIEGYIKSDVTDLFVLTDPNGLELPKGKKVFDVAKKSAEKKKSQKDGNIYWTPLIWQDEVVVVCGLKTKGNVPPKEEASLLFGLLEELAYEEFLESQSAKLLDPKSEFVSDLLESEKFKNFEEAIDKGDILGINLRAPQAVILIEIPGYFKAMHKKHGDQSKERKSHAINEECQVLISRLSGAFMNYEQNIFSCLSEDLFVCLKWAKGEVNTLNTIKFFKEKANYIREVIEKETKISPTIGVGQYYPGLAGLKKSYEDAKSAMEIGKKIWGPHQNYHITDVGMFVALSAKISYERKCELAFQILGLAFEDKDLYKTLNVFLDNDMNLSVASKKLHLHRNTLIYRLDKVKKTVGLDPRKFSDAVQIKLGILLYSPDEKC